MQSTKYVKKTWIRIWEELINKAAEQRKWAKCAHQLLIKSYENESFNFIVFVTGNTRGTLDMMKKIAKERWKKDSLGSLILLSRTLLNMAEHSRWKFWLIYLMRTQLTRNKQQIWKINSKMSFLMNCYTLMWQSPVTTGHTETYSEPC